MINNVIQLIPNNMFVVENMYIDISQRPGHFEDTETMYFLDVSINNGGYHMRRMELGGTPNLNHDAVRGLTESFRHLLHDMVTKTMRHLPKD